LLAPFKCLNFENLKVSLYDQLDLTHYRMAMSVCN